MKQYRTGIFLPDYIMEKGKMRKLWRLHIREFIASNKQEALWKAELLAIEMNGEYGDLEVCTNKNYWRTVDISPTYNSSYRGLFSRQEVPQNDTNYMEDIKSSE